MEVIDRSNEEPLTPQEIAFQLNAIEKWCLSQPTDGPGLGVLTTLERSHWAANREYLTSLHSQNADNLKRIEEALLVISFDDSEPLTQKEVSFHRLSSNLHANLHENIFSTISFLLIVTPRSYVWRLHE